MAGQYSLKLDDDPLSPFYGDIAVENNNWTFTEPGPDDTRQALQCNYRAFRGEWFLDTSIGCPWFQDILKKNANFPIIQSVLKTVGLDTEGVLGILQFDFDFDSPSRRFRLDAEFLADDGSGTGTPLKVNELKIEV